AFRRLIEAGHSLLVIEHNLDVMRAADWIIDLGPEGGDAGGALVGAGTPAQIMRLTSSHTGRALRESLDGAALATAAHPAVRDAGSGAEQRLNAGAQRAVRPQSIEIRGA